MPPRLSCCGLLPRPGTAGDRYQVVVHVDADALTGTPDVPEAPDVPAGTSPTVSLVPERRGAGREARAAPTLRADRGRLACRSPAPCPGPPSAASARVGGGQTVLAEAGGIHISAETGRRLACDAATVGMQHGPGGEIGGVSLSCRHGRQPATRVLRFASVLRMTAAADRAEPLFRSADSAAVTSAHVPPLQAHFRIGKNVDPPGAVPATGGALSARHRPCRAARAAPLYRGVPQGHRACRSSRACSNVPSRGGER